MGPEAVSDLVPLKILKGGSGRYMKESWTSGLPKELSDAAWLVEDGITTPTNRHWEFQKGGVYQIGQGVSQRALLIHLRDEGRHHLFCSYLAGWQMSYTDQQLHGTEVLRMAENVKSCPYCGEKVLKAYE